ncbi:MAG TPA: type ISP restriction/modification enzyme, partial [Candidatus Bathyarchaeia archaeon]
MPLFARDLVDEAKAASDIKETAPVMVVLGNPPYSGHSKNRGDWIRTLIETYKEGCPELHKPAQAKWLSDDYVKFIRFAQWRIEQTGYGILAFVTNHAYLDNPTFRGMRRSLMRSFDDIYILDLHGSSKKQEQSPDGGKDENVFDIQQGVAVGVFVKRETGQKEPATVRFSERWGLREAKYAWLWEHDVEGTKWRTLKPSEPQYFFVPKSGAGRSEYGSGWAVPAIFAKNGDPAPGIVTTHDDFAISWSRKEAEDKVKRFLATKTEEEARKLFKLCSQDQWQYDRAKRELDKGDWKDEVVPILYRPFDVRWTVFNRNVAVHRRERMTKHLLAGENIALCTNRQVNGDFRHVFCTKLIATDSTVSTATKERTYLFPLYQYTNGELPGLHDNVRNSSLSDKCVADFAARLKMKFISDGGGDRRKTFGPEDVFAYLYAMLHSQAYRERFSEFLRSDFPRIPLTSNASLFRSLCDLGEQLIAQHTLEGAGPPTTEFPV